MKLSFSEVPVGTGPKLMAVTVFLVARGALTPLPVTRTVSGVPGALCVKTILALYVVFLLGANVIYTTWLAPGATVAVAELTVNCAADDTILETFSVPVPLLVITTESCFVAPVITFAKLMLVGLTE